MSNISRRDFLKTAGVMTLAVAAAGVLAGCEGNNNNEQLPEVNETSATIGEYTVSIKDVKQLAVKDFDPATGEEKLDKNRYVVVLCNIKNNDPTFTAVPGFEMSIEKKGMQGPYASITNASVKKMFGLNEEIVNPYEGGLDITKPVQNVTANGKLFYYVFNVEHETVGEVTTYKTPSFRLTLNEKGEKYYHLVATIPAPEAISAADLTL